MEKITALLKHEGVKVGKIAGHQVQIDRAAAMRRFKKKELSLLMVTDVAARGLDIENLPAVINYDIPRDATTYTHRVGRTGRMGQAGFVISLGDDHDIRNLKKILRELDQPAEKLAIANRQIMTATKARQVAEQAADEKQVSAPVTEEAPQKDPLRDVKTRKAATKVSSVASSKPKKKGKKKHLKRKGKPRVKKSN